MKSHLFLSLFFLLPVIMISNFSIIFCEELAYQVLENSCHDDHLNNESDDFPNDYTPLIIPIDSSRRITVSPIITCTCHENDTWHPNHHPCRMAQTILVDNDWNDGNANVTYIFEDWIDYDWNDIIVNLYASISDGIFLDLFLAFREAGWKNPFGLEITAEATWIKIEWNSTDYQDMHLLTIGEGETVEVNLFSESNVGKEALIRFLIPPFASFSWQPARPFVGETVLFNASASVDFDKEIETYSWIFGDETSVDTDNPIITHSFISPGTYSVNLTVIDSDGLIDVVSRHIEVVAAIGGETVSLDNILITVWRNTTMILIIAFMTISFIIRRKKRLFS